MPMTVNGFGTSVCGGRGNIGWGSFDAMEWITAAYMPIIPIKCIHTFDWRGQQYRMIPIRWSLDLLIRTFVSRWAWGVGGLGAIFLLIGFLDKTGNNLMFFAWGAGLFLLAVLIAVWLFLSDRRNKNIRLVLGPMTVGNCDPVNMHKDMQEKMAGDTQLLYGTVSYAKAAKILLSKGSFARAMFTARMATALEDAAGGEALTDEILADPEVIDSLERVRRKAAVWADEMMTAEELEQAAKEDEIEELQVVEDKPKHPEESDDRFRGERGR